MFRLGNFDIVNILVRAIVVLLAISVHEMCHGYASYLLGDKTAKAMGRLSLNPLKHLDPFGALCLLLFGFGWAKPVMVNPVFFKKPKRDLAIVSLAGPLSNFLMALISALLLKIFTFTGYAYIEGTRIFCIQSFPVELLVSFLTTGIMLNIGLGVFNLLPIPPLDGSKIFLPLLPYKLYVDIMRYEHLGWIILMVALGLGVLDPIVGSVGNVIYKLLFYVIGGV